MDSAITIGELVRRKRRAEHLNQMEVADMFGVNQSTIAKWERGTNPRANQLPAIAKFVGVPLTEVMSLYHSGSGDEFAETIEEIRTNVATLVTEVGRLTAQLPTTNGSHRPDEPGLRRRRRAAQGAG